MDATCGASAPHKHTFGSEFFPLLGFARPEFFPLVVGVRFVGPLPHMSHQRGVFL